MRLPKPCPEHPETEIGNEKATYRPLPVTCLAYNEANNRAVLRWAGDKDLKVSWNSKLVATDCPTTLELDANGKPIPGAQGDLWIDAHYAQNQLGVAKSLLPDVRDPRRGRPEPVEVFAAEGRLLSLTGKIEIDPESVGGSDTEIWPAATFNFLDPTLVDLGEPTLFRGSDELMTLHLTRHALIELGLGLPSADDVQWAVGSILLSRTRGAPSAEEASELSRAYDLISQVRRIMERGLDKNKTYAALLKPLG